MTHSVHKIALFTLAACPIGRSMGTVLQEIAALHPEIEQKRAYVEIETEDTNRYRVKTNPTTLFLSEDGQELYRLEGFKETSEIQDILEKLDRHELTTPPEHEENREVIEKYTVYLYKDKGHELVPLEVEYLNRTSVKAPRITATRLLVQAEAPGYKNPFPSGTTLELVQFKENQGQITLHFPEHIKARLAEGLPKMTTALQKTLSHFGISEVEIISNESTVAVTT